MDRTKGIVRSVAMLYIDVDCKPSLARMVSGRVTTAAFMRMDVVQAVAYNNSSHLPPTSPFLPSVAVASSHYPIAAVTFRTLHQRKVPAVAMASVSEVTKEEGEWADPFEAWHASRGRSGRSESRSTPKRAQADSSLPEAGRRGQFKSMFRIHCIVIRC